MVKRVQYERREQQWLVAWFRLQYPHVLIVASANGGARDPLQGRWAKLEGVLAGIPDVQVIRACRGYHGLFIEMKPTPHNGKKAWLRTLQKEIMEQINFEGYLAKCCWGIEEAKQLIRWYMIDDSLTD